MNFLVIDDDKQIGAIMLAHLRNLKHEVVLAENPKVGAALCISGTFDVIITDVCMPDVDGLEILAIIQMQKKEKEEYEKEHGKDSYEKKIPKCIVMTGGGQRLAAGGMQMDSELALGLGALAVLFKPFNKNDIKEIINKLEKGQL